MEQPLLIGPQIIFTPAWTPDELTILGHEITSYKKTPFPPAIPTFEIGPLGQMSQRQLNMSTVPYRFEWIFTLDPIKKGHLEGIIAGQMNRYANNNTRTDVNVLYSDERYATLELAAFSRKVREPELRFDENPTSLCRWQFSQFLIKFESFVQQRKNSDFWTVNCTAIESQLDLEG